MNAEESPLGGQDGPVLPGHQHQLERMGGAVEIREHQLDRGRAEEKERDFGLDFRKQEDAKNVQGGQARVFRGQENGPVEAAEEQEEQGRLDEKAAEDEGVGDLKGEAEDTDPPAVEPGDRASPEPAAAVRSIHRILANPRSAYQATVRRIAPARSYSGTKPSSFRMRESS